MENNPKSLNANGSQLCAGLIDIKNAKKAETENGRCVNVAGVGSIVSTAYEQLRNAAENSQESLLLRRAMRRFFSRELLLTASKREVDYRDTAEELVVELTQAGYLENNTQPIEVIDELKNIVERQFSNHRRLCDVGLDERKAQSWTLDLLTVGCERILKLDKKQGLYLEFAYHHYQTTIPQRYFSPSVEDNYEASLYVAVHRSLIKSDIAAVRYDMQRLYNISDEVLVDYIKFHEGVDEIFSSDMTNKITRHINKYGAPLRIFYSLIQDEENAEEILADRDCFEKAYKKQIEKEYKKAGKRLNRNLIRSIAFLLITKTLIGLAIEVPYDIATLGVVLMTPLLVNLFSPVVYLILLRIGVKMPGEVNTKALALYADEMLYSRQEAKKLYPMSKEKKYPVGFTVAYVVMFLIVFSVAVYVLNMLKFSLVQGVVFFMFLAAASLLGFRLLYIVKEIEIESGRRGFLISLRDFFFMPFTALGKWIGEKYQKYNFVAMILDTCVELPLKTILRLIRQWTRFLDEKQSRL